MLRPNSKIDNAGLRKCAYLKENISLIQLRDAISNTPFNAKKVMLAMGQNELNNFHNDNTIVEPTAREIIRALYSKEIAWSPSLFYAQTEECQDACNMRYKVNHKNHVMYEKNFFYWSRHFRRYFPSRETVDQITWLLATHMDQDQEQTAKSAVLESGSAGSGGDRVPPVSVTESEKKSAASEREHGVELIEPVVIE
ncbi:hypothetical protein U1Q18_047803 [Sarracenia purpurea var. burkii]